MTFSLHVSSSDYHAKLARNIMQIQYTVNLIIPFYWFQNVKYEEKGK